ncbi:MAG: glycosyltransferase, partial [Deltaproteobacteria bacterium]|nr:glycosyltransferase [Deltaproteobacteria bacterium]
MPTTPFFTIVTATYNAAEVLSGLLDSLTAQTCQSFEVLIQDGGSSDATVEIIAGYKDRLNVRWASEKDSGIYDAWNKALPAARGEWILFLGADDRLDAPDVLERCFGVMRDLPCGVLYAGG